MGLSRASTSCYFDEREDVDGRDEPGHDDERLVVFRQRQPEGL